MIATDYGKQAVQVFWFSNFLIILLDLGMKYSGQGPMFNLGFLCLFQITLDILIDQLHEYKAKNLI